MCSGCGWVAVFFFCGAGVSRRRDVLVRRDELCVLVLSVLLASSMPIDAFASGRLRTHTEIISDCDWD